MYPNFQSSALWLRLLMAGLVLGVTVADACASGPASITAPGTRVMISRVAPQYPELARRMHVEGTVIMRIVVKPDGTVSDAHTESGHPLLRQAAEEAVSQWRFGSAPDATSMNIQVVFAR